MKRRSIAVVLLGSVVAISLAACSRSTPQKGDKEGAPGAPSAGQALAASGDESRTVLQNKGSDTLVNVAQAWAEAYKKINPKIAIAVSGGGSGVGLSALVNGTVDIANSSRAIKPKEIEAAQGKGITPKEFLVGYDALAVYVHKDNPKKEFTLEELKDVYAEGGKVAKWSDLGIKVPGCPSDEIVRVSRQNNSGTYAYFKEAVIGEKGEYRLGSRDMHGSKDVVDLVEKTPCAIGYSGLAYASPNVGVPCVKKAKDQPCVAPTEESAMNGNYPIARPLFMYTPGEPKGAAKTYLDWVMSDEAQCIIMKMGYSPTRKLACK